MRTSIHRVVRCELVTGGSEKSAGTRQPWLCPPDRVMPNAQAQYNQFWESVLGDRSSVDTFYDNELAVSGTQAEIDTVLADDSAWKARLAEMDAQWAELDARRVAENERSIAAAEVRCAELVKSMGELAALRS